MIMITFIYTHFNDCFFSGKTIDRFEDRKKNDDETLVTRELDRGRVKTVQDSCFLLIM